MKNQSSNLQLEIRSLIAKIIEVDPEKITPNTNFIKDLGSDSMMALEMMASLEKKYEVTIPEDQLVKITSLEEVTKLISSLIESHK